MSRKNTAGSCECCDSCVYLLVDTDDSLNKLEIDDTEYEYEWDGVQIPPGASLRTKKLMPDGHYFVKVNVVAEDANSGVFDLEFWTPHVRFIRVALDASAGLNLPLTGTPPPRHRYWSTVTLETETDSKTWFDDRQLITESEYIFGPRPPLLNPVSLTRFYVSDGVAWREAVEPAGVLTEQYTIESPSVSTDPGYYYSVDPGPLIIKNTGDANLSFVSIEVYRIRGLVSSTGDRSLTFIEPDPTDDVPNPTCDEHFPECWDQGKELSKMSVAFVPAVTEAISKPVDRGCEHRQFRITGLVPSPPINIILNQDDTEPTPSLIGSGTTASGHAYEAFRVDYTSEDFSTEMPSALESFDVSVSIARLTSTETNEDDDEYFPFRVSTAITVTSRGASLHGKVNADGTLTPGTSGLPTVWTSPEGRYWQFPRGGGSGTSNFVQDFETLPAFLEFDLTGMRNALLVNVRRRARKVAWAVVDYTFNIGGTNYYPTYIHVDGNAPDFDIINFLDGLNVPAHTPKNAAKPNTSPIYDKVADTVITDVEEVVILITVTL